MAQSLRDQILNNLQNKKESLNIRVPIPILYKDFELLMEGAGNAILKRRNEIITFTIDANVTAILTIMHNWLTCKSNHNKGILLIGNYGCGKSLLLESFCDVYKELAKYQDYKLKVPTYYKSTDLVNDLIQYGFLDKFTKFPLFIDELGREPIRILRFGNNEEPMVEMLMKRWDNGALTFGTSNFKLETLSDDKYYGKMIGDRLKQLFTVIEMKGTSRRK